MLNTMLFRRFYKGAGFDSPLLKMFSPLVNFADKVAQHTTGTNKESPLPPFMLRARSGGVINQFGGKRFVEHSSSFIDFLISSKLVHKDRKNRFVEIGCGVGRLPRALKLREVTVDYIGIDIDPPSVKYCESVFDSATHQFHLLDVNNGTYRPQGSGDPGQVRFEMVEDGSADMVTAWSVFTHMEIDHIRHYLKEVSRMLGTDSHAVLSAFVYNERPWLKNNFKFQYNEGYTVNLENPMKAIAFSESIYQQAFEDAGLKQLMPFIPMRVEGSETNHQLAQGQDLFILVKKNFIQSDGS